MTTVIADHGSFTIDDLDSFPQDSNRYELIEGSLHVTPAPTPRHQRVSANLFRLLDAAAPGEFEVLTAPLDVQLGADTMVEPDLLVVPAGPLPDKRLEIAPHLVVEILSPRTRLYDLGTKRLVYREAGVGAYWVVDPAAVSLTVWRWHDADDADDGPAVIEGDDVAGFDWPFPVTVTPARLLLPRG